MNSFAKLESHHQLAGGPSDTATPPPRRSASPPQPPAATYLCKLHQFSTPPPTATHKTPTNAVHSLSAPSAATSTGTPVRKVSASSFLSSITQFYTGATVPPATTSDPTEPHEVCSVEGCNGGGVAEESFPEIKGRVESKLMSMWHNVKYGK